MSEQVRCPYCGMDWVKKTRQGATTFLCGTVSWESNLEMDHQGDACAEIVNAHRQAQKSEAECRVHLRDAYFALMRSGWEDGPTHNEMAERILDLFQRRGWTDIDRANEDLADRIRQGIQD